MLDIGQNETLLPSGGLNVLARHGDPELFDMLRFYPDSGGVRTTRFGRLLRRQPALLTNRSGSCSKCVFVRRVPVPHVLVGLSDIRRTAFVVGVEPREISELQRDSVRAAATMRLWTSGVDRQNVENATKFHDARICLAETTRAKVKVKHEDPLLLSPRNATRIVLDFESKRGKMTSHGDFSAREVLRPEGTEVRSIITMCNTDDSLGVISAFAINKEIAARLPEAVVVKEGLSAQTIEFDDCAFDASSGHIA